MSKKALIGELTSMSPGYQGRPDAEHAIDVVTRAISQIVERGDKVQLRGFGNFQMKDRKGRKGRNPQTGETITIAPKRVLVFEDRRKG